MSYRPVQSVAFGPPLRAHVPSLLYLGAALAIVLIVIVGSLSDSSSWLFRYIVVADSRRVLGSRPLAAIILVSALAAVARVRMRGVVIHPEGLEARDTYGAGFPRVRKFAWPQIDRIVLDVDAAIMLELWDGRTELLPRVGKRQALADMLERVAVARAIPVRGGSGDVEPPEPEED
jgi:hypothetical protein